MDVVALTEPLTRTVSIAYRATAARRPALQLVIDAVRATAAELGLSAAGEWPGLHEGPPVRADRRAFGWFRTVSR